MNEDTTNNEQEGEEQNDAPQSEASNSSGGDNIRTISALAYLIFFIPMLTNRDSSFAMFHANQGLNLFITFIVVNTVGWIIPIIGWFLILPLGSLFILILFIIGVVNALNGKEKKLPLIGGFQLIK